MRYAVIMAGGSGTRLWPLSLKDRPKQLMHIVEGKSLLRLACERLLGWLPAENLYVITGEAYIDQVHRELPELPRENLVGEPCGRDTVNAIGMMAHLLARLDPDGVMGVFTADQVIRPVEPFRAALEKAYGVAEREPDALVTFGIPPASPHTGYGYVHRGEALEAGVFAVRQFKEKPPLELAQQYVSSGEYFWNSGMFVWRCATFLRQLELHVPDSHAKLGRIAAADGERRAALMRELYPTLTKISVDFAVMEKAERGVVVEMPCEWLDVGSWTSLREVLAPDAQGNVRAGVAHRTLDAAGNVLVAEGDHLIAAIGVSDLVVVAGPNATLICRKEDAQRVKDIVADLQKEGLERYL